MKKYIYQLLIIAVIAPIISSCKKILDKPPLTVITSTNYFQNGDDAESAITGCYDGFQDDSYYGSVLNVLGEMPSDNDSSANSDVFTLNKIQWTATTSQPGRIYQIVYVSINRANSVLKYVPGITKEITAERRNQILGEAYFIRALDYFNLVKCFGGVPLHLLPTESEAQSAMARSTQDQVYAQIESDLSQAEALLPTTFGGLTIDRTRATKGAANALQAKVYLYERKWSESVAAAAKVIANSNYDIGLTMPYADLFPFKNKQESIFEIQFAGTDDGGFSLPDLILPSPPAVYSFPKYDIPSTAFIKNIDTVHGLDARFKYLGNVPGGRNFTSLIYGGKGKGNDEGWFIYKWRSTNFFASEDNYPILTLDDIYLMYAEASNELNGPNQDALDKLNAIMTRATLTPYTLGALNTKNSFRDAVDIQRRLELAFQGDRWFDLVRYSNQTIADPTAVHKMDALTHIQLVRKDANITNNSHYLLYPLPLDELNTNPLAKQNPGF